jgi:outer membrane protein assembly factor BamB
VAGTHAGLVRCFYLITGEPMWEYDLGQALTVPLVADTDGHVFFGTADGWILCLSTARGKPIWRWRIGARTADAGVVVGHRYCVASYDAALHALDTSNGHLAWRSPLPSRPLGAPVIHENLVFVLCYGEQENSSALVAIESTAGRRAGTFEVPGEALGAPLLVKEHFIVTLRVGAIASFAFAAPEEATEPGAGSPGSAPHGRPRNRKPRPPR